MEAKIYKSNTSLYSYLIVLLFEYILTGWLLSDFNAPWLTWAGTQAVTIHLAWVGFDAVALAIAWIVGIVWAGAFSLVWFKSIPWAGISIWAIALAGIWILALAFILTLAQTESKMKSVGLSKYQAFSILILIAWVGLAIGRTLDSGILIH